MSDFSLSVYTYDDIVNDYSLQSFNISHDKAAMIPIISKAKAANPSLMLIGTPWTAPTWLKGSNARGDGSIIDSDAAYSTYAAYLLKAAQGYADNGLPLDYLTLQNEPLHSGCGNMPCMLMGSDSQVRLAQKVAAQIKQGVTTSKPMLLAYDHNWDNVTYPMEVLSLAGDLFAGVCMRALLFACLCVFVCLCCVSVSV